MNDQTKTPEQLAETYRVRIHEFGHFLVCSKFRINSDPQVFSEAERYPASNGAIVAGICRIDEFSKATRFQESVVGWGGVVAEALLSLQHSLGTMPFPLYKATLRDWYRVAMTNLGRLSLGDQRLICGYKSTWVSFKAAYRILSKNKSKLVRMARPEKFAAADAAEAARIEQTKWQGIPRPLAFPATHDDFVRLVCHNAECFDRFLVSRAALHLTNNRTTSIDDAKLALRELFGDALVFSQRFVSGIYAGDFPTADSWLTAAKAFQQWEGENK